MITDNSFVRECKHLVADPEFSSSGWESVIIVIVIETLWV